MSNDPNIAAVNALLDSISQPIPPVSEGEVTWYLTGKNAQESGSEPYRFLEELAEDGMAPQTVAERKAYFAGFNMSEEAEAGLGVDLAPISMKVSVLTNAQWKGLEVLRHADEWVPIRKTADEHNPDFPFINSRVAKRLIELGYAEKGNWSRVRITELGRHPIPHLMKR